MSTSTQISEADWSVPASRGELFLVKTELESKIDQVATDLRVEIAGVRADLRIGLKDMQVGLVRIVWTAVATLGAVGILLRFL